MAPLGRRRRDANTRRADALLGYLIPLVFVGLTITDYLQHGHIDKYLIGADLIFGLGALGYRVDTIIETYLAAKAGLPAAGGTKEIEKDVGTTND